MRRLLVVILFCLLSRPLTAAPMFPDVPDMWAKDAVAALAAKGILEGYPDGTFKGDRAATRYEVAMIVARLLAKMEQEHATFATRADLDELRKLVGQLREELDALGVRVQSLEDSVARLDKRVTELERITFYGSLDARFSSMRMSNDGLRQGTNGNVNNAGPVPLGPGTTITNPQVGPPIFTNTTDLQNRPTQINAFPWNASPLNGPNTAANRPSYDLVVGSNRSLGGDGPTATYLATGGNPFLGLTGTMGQLFAVPLVVPTFEVRTGRPWANGTGYSGSGILGVRIKLNEDMDAGTELAAYWSAGDAIQDAFYGVSAPYQQNVFTSQQSFGAAGSFVNTGQGLGHDPYTRMAIDSFWFVHKPSGVKVQLGSYGDVNATPIVYQPEYNPNLWGPRYLDNYGFRVSGGGHLLARIDWEVFGSLAADGNHVNSDIQAVGGTPYRPYLWGANVQWAFGREGSSGRLKLDLLRIWDDNAPGQPLTVGSISNVNGVWLDWANPSGFYVNQLAFTDGGTTATVPQLASVAGAGSTSDVRPITAAPAFGGNVDAADIATSGMLGNVTLGILAPVGASAGTFGPQSMFTWGVSGGWDHTFSDRFKLRVAGEYSSSDYKPSQNSSYTAPDGNAWRFGVGGTLFRDFDLDAEYVSVDPFHNPYVLQYPNAMGVTQAWWRIPTLSWFPEMYPINDKDIYPNNREGFRLFFKWNPTDPRDGKRKTVLWAEYGNLEQERTSLQGVRFSQGSITPARPVDGFQGTPNSPVLGQLPGFVDTVFTGFHITSFAGFNTPTNISDALAGINQYATPLENPQGRVTNWGGGLNYRFDQLNGLALHAGYKTYEFRRASALGFARGGSENNIRLNLSGGLVAVQYPVNERFALKGGFQWTDIRGHYDPLGIYRNYAADTGNIDFDTFNQTQTAPFIGFDHDVARNVSWTLMAKWLDSNDNIAAGTFQTPNFKLQRNPFSWSGFSVSSQVRVTF